MFLLFPLPPAAEGRRKEYGRVFDVSFGVHNCDFVVPFPKLIIAMNLISINSYSLIVIVISPF